MSKRRVVVTGLGLITPVGIGVTESWANIISGQSGIGKNLSDGEVVQGSPAFNYGDFAKSFVHFKNLPKIVSEIEQLKKQ